MEREEEAVVVMANEAEEGREGRGLIRLAGTTKASLPPSTHAVRSNPTESTCRCRRMLLMVPLLAMEPLVLVLELRGVCPASAAMEACCSGYTHAPGPALCVKGKCFLLAHCANGVGMTKDECECKWE